MQQIRIPMIGEMAVASAAPAMASPIGTVSYTHLDVYKRQDIMAKAETGNRPIGGKEVNPNLEKVWNEKMKGKIARYNIETRRKEVRDVIEQTIPMMLNMYETHNEQTGGCENGN